MADNEEAARREAVRRVMAGEPVAAVARALGRSEPWVRKWMRRYDPADAGWAAERSRAPRVVGNRTDAEIEELIVKVRKRLAAHPWAQVGAVAIAWELTKLGVEEVPPLRTIERVLERHGVPRRPRRSGGRYRPKGTPYPTPPCEAPNACQQAEGVGPRHLQGGAVLRVQHDRRGPSRCGHPDHAVQVFPGGVRGPAGGLGRSRAAGAAAVGQPAGPGRRRP